MDEREMFMNMIFKMANYMHERSAIFKKYKNARRVHQEVINSMMDYLNKNDINPDEVLMSLKRDLELDLNQNLDNHIFADLVIYPHIPEYECITQLYLRKRRLRNIEKVRMLESMMNSYYSVFNIVKRNEEDGVVTLYDVIRHENIDIVDGKLGMNYKGDQYIVLRIIQFDDIKFQTGLVMIIDNDKIGKQLIDHVTTYYQDHYTNVLLDLFEYQKPF